MKYPILNLNGKEEGEMTLPKEIFEAKFNADLVHQVAVALAGNKRQISAHTKNRGEVRGGGKKPWRQKGTGRARHGSIRSPLWRGGGITFGPRTERVFKREVPKKMRRKALFMVLSEKAKNKELIVLENFQMQNPKTKDAAKILAKMPSKGKTLLIALPEYNKNTVLSARNIEKTKVKETRNLNVLDILNAKYLLLTKDGIKKIKEIFAK